MSNRPRTAVVTGASRGLGRAIALALAEADFHLVLVARSKQGLEETADRIKAAGGKAECFLADLTDPARVAALAASLADGLDVLVNNAGVIDPLGRFAEVDFEAWAQSLRVNIEGTARVTHVLLPALRAAPRATIVTISSGAAVSDIDGWSAYCTGKSALDRFACVLDAELKDAGIRSFSFAPGTIETEMQKAIRSTGVGPAKLVSGDIEHLPAEVPARAVAFLTTSAAMPLAGRHIDIRYPEVREALDLPSA